MASWKIFSLAYPNRLGYSLTCRGPRINTARSPLAEQNLLSIPLHSPHTSLPHTQTMLPAGVILVFVLVGLAAVAIIFTIIYKKWQNRQRGLQKFWVVSLLWLLLQSFFLYYPFCPCFPLLVWPSKNFYSLPFSFKTGERCVLFSCRSPFTRDKTLHSDTSSFQETSRIDEERWNNFTTRNKHFFVLSVCVVMSQMLLFLLLLLWEVLPHCSAEIFKATAIPTYLYVCVCVCVCACVCVCNFFFFCIFFYLI